MAILTASDFSTGFYSTSVNKFTQEDLESYLDEVEKRILRDLLSDALYTEYVTNVGTETKFQKLRDGETYTNPDGETVIYEGFKEMLLGFTYYSFIRDQQNNNRIAGNFQSQSENDTRTSSTVVAQNVSMRYNRGVDKYCEAIRYIEDKNELVADTFENFEYKEKSKLYLNGYII